MKLLILNGKRSSSYGIYNEQLLFSFLRANGYFIKEETSIVASDANASNPEKEIFYKAYEHRFFSFLNAFRIRLFIKKQNIKWLALFAYENFFSSSLPQVIVPVNTEKIIINKPLPDSARIIVGSKLQKENLLSLYPSITENIRLVSFSSIRQIEPVLWSEKQAFKFAHTQGREFFLIDVYNASADFVLSLLKAFSAFKKWQQSNMKLVLNKMSHRSKIAEVKAMLSTYRFRDDVILTDDAIMGKEYITLLSSAYAFLHLPSGDDNVVPLLDAMRCETPCISIASDIIREYCDEAALFIERGNYEELSKQMITLYKDENLRDKLIAAGKQRTKLYSKENAMTALAGALPVVMH